MSLAYRTVSQSFLREFTGDDYLEEEYSKYAKMPQFAVVSPDGRQIGPWMKCKDYIQDVWWGYQHKRSYECHGFSYQYGEDPAPSNRYLLLAIRWEGKTPTEIRKMLDNVKRTVENLEKRLRIPRHLRTRFSRQMNDYFIVYGCPKWLGAVKLVSFFSWLLRASLCNDGGRIETINDTCPVKKDAYYKKQGMVFIKHLLKAGIDSIKSDWMEKRDIYTCHSEGFVHAAHRMNGGTPSDYYDELDALELGGLDF